MIIAFYMRETNSLDSFDEVPTHEVLEQRNKALMETGLKELGEWVLVTKDLRYCPLCGKLDVKRGHQGCTADNEDVPFYPGGMEDYYEHN